MADPQGQEPTNQPGQEPADPPAPAAPSTPPNPPETPGQEPERYDAEYVKSLRKSEAATRKRLQELEAKQKDAEDAQLSETERLTKKVAELEQQKADADKQRQERTVRYEVLLAARRLNVVDEDAAYRLLDLDKVTFADDGQPTNVEALLKDLTKAKPYLLAPPAAQAVPATPKADGGSGLTEQQEKEARERLSREYARAW